MRLQKQNRIVCLLNGGTKSKYAPSAVAKIEKSTQVRPLVAKGLGTRLNSILAIHMHLHLQLEYTNLQVQMIDEGVMVKMGGKWTGCKCDPALSNRGGLHQSREGLGHSSRDHTLRGKCCTHGPTSLEWENVCKMLASQTLL